MCILFKKNATFVKVADFVSEEIVTLIIFPPNNHSDISEIDHLIITQSNLR